MNTERVIIRLMKELEKILREEEKAEQSESQSAANREWPEPLQKYGDLLTVEDAAEVLQISPRSIYRLVDKDELLAVKVGHRLYFPRKTMVERLGFG